MEVAAQRLIKDEVHVLHTIGGDDTNTQAAELSKYILEKHGGRVTVVGMPKTVDNVSRMSFASSCRPHFLTCFLKEPLSVNHESGEFHDDPLQRAPLSAVEDEDSIAAHYNGSRSNYFHDNSTAGYFSRYG